MAKSLILKVDSDLYRALKKRADTEYLDVEGLVEDIIRRSMLSYKKRATSTNPKIDDRLVGIFSRSRRGRKKKKKK